MEPAWAVTLAVLAAALPSLLLVLIIYSYSRRLWRKYFVKEPEPVPIDRRDAALKRSALMASLWRSSIPLRAFQWSEHPSHVITALEHGWAAFAFTYAASAMGAFAGPVHQMWEMCGSCSAMKFCAPEITWTSQSSEECMQQIRLNPGLRSNKDGCVLPVQALQTAMPLPGPVLGPCPYPQESYFELLVLASGNELISEHSSLAGSERVKLIAQTLTSDRYQRGQSLGEFNDTEFCRKVNSQLKRNADVEYDKNGISSDNILTGSENEQKGDGGLLGDESMLQKVDQIDWDELLSVGLAGADAPPFRLLGFDPGSVGFLSADGQCYVNGMPLTQGKELVPSKGRPWGAVKTTVGCGFDPRMKRVYFTVNGELVHEAFLKSADFGNPLYPTIASNYDVTVLVNLGQRTFEYVPANVARVANPCCRILQARPVRKSSSFFDDDISTDLFSMGRFDSHWLSDLEHRHGYSEADSDLFEIVLDGGHTLKRQLD